MKNTAVKTNAIRILEQKKASFKVLSYDTGETPPSAAGEKNIAMVKSKELLPLTGYVHGGCSPVGMKKIFPTFIDQSAENCGTITVSGGKIGMHVDIALSELRKAVKLQTCDLTV